MFDFEVKKNWTPRGRLEPKNQVTADEQGTDGTISDNFFFVKHLHDHEPVVYCNVSIRMCGRILNMCASVSVSTLDSVLHCRAHICCTIMEAWFSV